MRKDNLWLDNSCPQIWILFSALVVMLTIVAGCGDHGSAGKNDPPVINRAISLNISEPLNGGSGFYGGEILFEALNDDGEIVRRPILWTSSLDGQIGDEPRFTYSKLSVGQHTITATIKDDNGKNVYDTLNLTIEVFSWAAIYKKNGQLNPRIKNEPLDIKSVEVILRTT